MAFVYWIHLPEHTDIKTQGYIGITTETVDKRYKRGHLSSARTGSKLRVHNAIRKYGNKIQVTTVLEDDIEFCQLVEWGYRSSINIGWNHGIGGESPRKGSKTSEETKKKLSIASKGRKLTDEVKAKMSKAQKNRIWTDEDKLRIATISKSRKGTKLSDSHRKALSLASNRDGKFCDLAKDNARAFHNNQPPWERGRSDTEIWKLSEKLYDTVRNNPSIGEVLLGKSINVKSSKVRKILKKIRSGWVPSDDPSFIIWLKQYNKKEADNAETQSS